MIVRSRCWLAAALGVSLLPFGSGWAGEPVLSDPSSAPSVSAPQPTNQAIADAIAARLRKCEQLHHHAIDIGFANGVAELTGTVVDAAQHDEALTVVRQVPGVNRIVDRLQIATAAAPRVNPILAVQAIDGPGPGGGPAPVLPTPTPTPPPPGAPPPEAVPTFQAPLPSPYQTDPPKMPPYAWPTYAPYNNFSRVATPTALPYNAWPFVGPVYPFPKVPLGWRAVKLEWDDGYWWYSKLSTKYDWWRLRYY